MKILQIIQRPQLRGAEIFAAQLSQHLKAMGHEVRMLALMEGNASLPFDGDIVVLKLALSNRLLDLAGWRKLAQVVKDFHPDVVQANAGDTLKYASLSKLIFGWGAPIVFRNANKVSDFIDTKPKLWLNKFLLTRVRYVISVSELCRLDFVATYGFDHTRTTTISIGIETGIEESELSDDVRKMLNGRRVILNVGSLVPEKNHAALIRLSRRLVDRLSDVCVLIVGDGRLRSTLQQQINKAGLESRVLLVGYRTDVHALMRNSSVLAVPSLVEGLPGVILEAFQAGLPVVANDVGGISEVVKSRETGWLVQKDDEEGFLASIEEVLKSAEMVTKIKHNAQTLVVSSFLNSALARKFADVYAKIL